MRILVVEDDPDLNRQIVTALGDAGYVVDKAMDGEEGHYLGETEPYDAVVLDLGRRGAGLGTGALDVLAILPASRVRAVGRGHEGEGAFPPVAGHLPQRVGQKRMPIAVAPVDRQVWTMVLQFRAQGGHEFAVLLVDRAHAVEQRVVARDRLQALELRHLLLRDHLGC